MITYAQENEFVLVVVGPKSVSEPPDERMLDRTGKGRGLRELANQEDENGALRKLGSWWEMCYTPHFSNDDGQCQSVLVLSPSLSLDPISASSSQYSRRPPEGWHAT